MRWIGCGGSVLFLCDRVVMNWRGSSCDGAHNNIKPDITR